MRESNKNDSTLRMNEENSSRQEVPGDKHRKHFKKWQNLAPQQTRFLSSLVESRLVPILESKGFRWVDISLNNPERPVSGNEIRLERVCGQEMDSVDFNFEKHMSPRFQIHFSRRELVPPYYSFIRSADLVARRGQYYHYWAKPWWLPTGFWSDRNSTRTIDALERKIDQLLSFLETGESGPNISRQD